MITDNTYYKGELYIPQAKPSISDGATAVDEEFTYMLDKFEEDCLIKCLGFSLYKELTENLDLTKPTLIKDAADAKWDNLVNGHTYTKQGATAQSIWRGIRFKSPITSKTYNRSFLANYVYWFYEKNRYITTTGVGSVKEEAKNGLMVTPLQKVVDAWNEFIELVQGTGLNVAVYNKGGLFGVDYLNPQKVITLYEYIEDQNALAEDTFAEFAPREWGMSNKFNI